MSESYDHRATHPAGIGSSASLWFGTEVEGTYRGHLAAFVAAELDAAELASLLKFLRDRRAVDDPTNARRRMKPIVFFTEMFEAWDWAAEFVIPYALIVCAGCYVGQLPTMLELRKRAPFDQLELMVRLFDAQILKELRRGDQVSVGVPYDMITFRVGDGVRTAPDDYLDDKAG